MATTNGKTEENTQDLATRYQVAQLAAQLKHERETWQSMVDTVHARHRSYVQSNEQEAYDPTTEEPGWNRLGASKTRVGGLNREDMNKAAWHYYRNDPMLHHAIELHNTYTFGKGVEAQAQDDRIQAIVDRFWNDQGNRDALTRAKSLYARNRERHLNGEVFFMLFVNRQDGMVRIRPIEPTKITKVIYDPDDMTRPLMYCYNYQQRTLDTTTGEYRPLGDAKKQFIPDYRNAATTAHKNYADLRKNNPNTEIYIYHELSNEIDGRGLATVAPAVNWVRAFKGFMEDRAMIQQAAALFAYKVKFDGNQNALNRMISDWGAYEDNEYKYGATPSGERRQGANVLFENKAMNAEQFKFDTAAPNAYMDGRMLRQLIGIGAGGVFEHYLAGDAATGNLATATAMELPMLKQFEAEQQLWSDILKDLLWFVIVQAQRSRTTVAGLGTVGIDSFNYWQLDKNKNIDYSIDIAFPDIVTRDAPSTLTALATVKQTEVLTGERLIPQAQAALTIMQLLGFEDAKAIVDTMLAETPDMQTNNTDDPTPSAPTAPSGDDPPIDTEQETEALELPDALNVEPFTQEELDDAIQFVEDLPPLEELMKRYDLTEADVEGET